MDTLVEASVPAAERRLPALVMIGLLAGPFMSMIDSSVVNVALAGIARGLSTDLAAAQWVISSYLLALALGLPASAYLARRFGTRRIYLLSIVGFTLASLACAFAPTLPVLIVTRTVQGLCGAPLVPLAMNILVDPNGAARRGIPPAAGILLFLAPAMGPTVGGLVLQVGTWPLIFLINVPVGVLGFLGARRIGTDLAPRGERAAHFDPLGLLMVGGGLALTLYGTATATRTSWLAAGAWPFWGAGACLLLIYVVYALARPHPALDLKLLRHPQSALALGMVVLIVVVMASTLLLTPLYLQQIQGASALTAGLVLLPQGLMTGVGFVLGNALARWRGKRACILVGTVALAASTALLLLLGLTTPAGLTALLLTGRGLATGLAIEPLLSIMLRGLTQRELPDGNTLFTVTDNLSGSVGIALLVTLFQNREVVRTSAVLVAHGIPVSVLRHAGSAAAGIPLALRQQLGEAVIAGLHDTILAMLLVALVGVVAALFVRA